MGCLMGRQASLARSPLRNAEAPSAFHEKRPRLLRAEAHEVVARLTDDERAPGSGA